MAHKTTQKDIANACGISTASVAYILSGSSRYKFRPETIQKVTEMAEKMNYRINQQAANLRRQENKLLICVLGSCCRHSDTLHLQALEREVEKHGFTLFVHFIIGLSDEQKVNAIRSIINLPAGLLIWSLGITDPEIRNSAAPIIKKGPPCLHLSHPMPGSGSDYIKVNWGGGSLPEMFKLFKSRNYTRVACCYGVETTAQTLESMFYEEGLKNNMECQIFSFPQSPTGNDLFYVGEQIAAQILAAPALPQAIYSVSDEISFVIINKLREHNIRVPEDIFIITGGDSEFMKHITPPPPIFIHDIEKLARVAVDDLTGRIERGETNSGNERCIAQLDQHVIIP